jgi:hypothetical protein
MIMSNATLERKLDTKTIVKDFKEIVLSMDDGENRDLYDLVGTCDGVITGNSNYGLWVAFTGEFSAVSFDADGATVSEHFSKKAFLPEPYETAVFEAMKQRAAGEVQEELIQGDGGLPSTSYIGLGVVQIALTIGIHRDSELPKGYKFITKSHMELKLSDGLSQLRGLLPDRKRLAASKAEPAPEQKPKAKK